MPTGPCELSELPKAPDNNFSVDGDKGSQHTKSQLKAPNALASAVVAYLHYAGFLLSGVCLTAERLTLKV